MGSLTGVACSALGLVIHCDVWDVGRGTAGLAVERENVSRWKEKRSWKTSENEWGWWARSVSARHNGTEM